MSNDLVFSVCHFNKNLHDGDYYSEFESPILEEVRLISSLILAQDHHENVANLYPLTQEIFLKETPDLSQKETLNTIKSLLLSNIEQLEQSTTLKELFPFNGKQYNFTPTCINKSVQAHVFNSLDIDNHLLMRGLSSLIKAKMLSIHTELFEAGHWALFIALDASFSLIRKELIKAGKSNPTSKDIGEFMETSFGETVSGKGYFEDYYEYRIQVFHPQNKFGVTPYPPLIHCHFYSLYDDLIKIYRWLITKNVS